MRSIRGRGLFGGRELFEEIRYIPYSGLFWGGVNFREKLERPLRNNIRGSKFRDAVPFYERG